MEHYKDLKPRTRRPSADILTSHYSFLFWDSGVACRGREAGPAFQGHEEGMDRRQLLHSVGYMVALKLTSVDSGLSQPRRRCWHLRRKSLQLPVAMSVACCLLVMIDTCFMVSGQFKSVSKCICARVSKLVSLSLCDALGS